MHEHVCVFQGEALCSPRLDRKRLLQECRSFKSKAREAMAGGLSTTMFVHICCLLLEREIEPTRTCDLIRASGVVVLFVRRNDLVVGDVERDGLWV